MFRWAKKFNQPIGSWNTSAVTDMQYMFYQARKFNQPIGSWDTSAVTDMQSMFQSAYEFNQPIGSWDTSAVTDMHSMFREAYEFNQPIGSWNTSAVTNMHYMFYWAHEFNQPIGSWDTSAVTNMEYMFYWAHEFNQPIGSWNTLAVTNMEYMFIGAISFDTSIGLWDISSLTSFLAKWGEDEQPDMLTAYWNKLNPLGLQKAKFDQNVSAMRVLQSQRAGVSIEYLLSADFAQLATQRTGKNDPTFDMKTAFWLAEDPIGRDIICPRDGRPGCALVDWIPRCERREQTHFMSWTWKYSLLEAQSALEIFQESLVGPCHFFMCFFTNNQYRILVEESSSGSDNLEEVFESNLKRIGQMVAILDTWNQPTYLTRVWTVYEQFVASTIQIKATASVQFVMPRAAADHLQMQISQGSQGIGEVIESLSQVDSGEAKAWKMEDEVKVKLITFHHPLLDTALSKKVGKKDESCELQEAASSGQQRRSLLFRVRFCQPGCELNRGGPDGRS
eukprot:Skav218325  [mRNA]  locus=scaffold2239:261690:267567:+ [translate_table: standard]